MPITTFPALPGLGYPQKRAPSFNTRRFEAQSGKRTFNPKQTFPRWRWELPYNFLRSAFYGSTGTFSELETLAAFFNSRSADGQVFKYTDPEDFYATSATFGTGDSTAVAFQLYRPYGGFLEPVYSAVPTEVRVGGTPSTAYTLGNTGVITFSTAAIPSSTSTLTWTGTFAFLCRFDEDSIDLQRFLKGLSQSGAVRFSNELGL